jgi:hypothetical protein
VINKRTPLCACVDVGLTIRVRARGTRCFVPRINSGRYAPVISFNFIKFIITKRSDCDIVLWTCTHAHTRSREKSATNGSRGGGPRAKVNDNAISDFSSDWSRSRYERLPAERDYFNFKQPTVRFSFAIILTVSSMRAYASRIIRGDHWRRAKTRPDKNQAKSRGAAIPRRNLHHEPESIAAIWYLKMCSSALWII